MARRISSSTGTGDYGALSLVVQLHYRVEYLRTVPASVFLPQPDVDSAIVRLTSRAPDELPEYDAETFSRVVKRGFSQRRKQLRNLLREEIPNWNEAANAVGFDPRARAEELGLEQWIALSNLARSPEISAEARAGSERFPVVDEEDRVVAAAPRAEVHGNNLRHRAVHILVFNQLGELFLQKRSRWKDRHPRLWDSSAAGHVDAGEDYDLAATRELQEELGITAKLARVAKLPATEKTGQEFIWLYRATHDGPFELPRSEIEYGEFFPVAVVSAWIKARPADFAPGFIECWQVYEAPN
jgi:16S rRNA (adenine1518-N6/adenine1519-N6)-dimethyltransferase